MRNELLEAYSLSSVLAEKQTENLVLQFDFFFLKVVNLLLVLYLYDFEH